MLGKAVLHGADQRPGLLVQHNVWQAISLFDLRLGQCGELRTELWGRAEADCGPLVHSDQWWPCICDWDGDGIADRMESTLYGTNWQEADTDGDGLDDGWEIENGLDPLDTGQPCITIGEGLSEVQCEDIPVASVDTEAETGEQNETFPNPDNGPLGDPDRDGLTNLDEAELCTNPRLKDTDGD